MTALSSFSLEDLGTWMVLSALPPCVFLMALGIAFPACLGSPEPGRQGSAWESPCPLEYNQPGSYPSGSLRVSGAMTRVWAVGDCGITENLNLLLVFLYL